MDIGMPKSTSHFYFYYYFSWEPKSLYSFYLLCCSAMSVLSCWGRSVSLDCAMQLACSAVQCHRIWGINHLTHIRPLSGALYLNSHNYFPPYRAGLDWTVLCWSLINQLEFTSAMLATRLCEGEGLSSARHVTSSCTGKVCCSVTWCDVIVLYSDSWYNVCSYVEHLYSVWLLSLVCGYSIPHIYLDILYWTFLFLSREILRSWICHSYWFRPCDAEVVQSV